MSNRLTFSLASLIFLIALGLVFAPTSVMAAAGGPTVTITEYTGKNADTPAVDHVQTRSDFRVKVTFSHLVATDLAASNVTVQIADSITSLLTPVTGGVTVLSTGSPGSGAAGVPATELTANKVYVLIVDTGDTAYARGYLSVSIAADQVNGGEAAVAGIGNQRGSYSTSNLPKNNDWTVTAALDATDRPMMTGSKIDGSDTFNVKFTYSGGTGAVPTLTAAQIQIRDAKQMPITDTTVISAGAPTTVGVVATSVLTVGTDALDTPIYVGVNPQWANAAPAGGLRIPAATAPAPTVIDPVVDIALVGAVDETAKTFEVKFEFEKATVASGETAAAVPTTLMASQITLQKEDPDDATAMTDSDAYVRDSDIIKVRDGVFLATVNYRLDTLPVYVGTSVAVSATTIDGTAVAAGDDPVLMVGMAQQTNNAPVFTEGATATRSVAENTAAGMSIGTPVAATDADSDTLTYTLGGTDMASFAIVSTSGQLQTMAALDYETKNAYMVMVTADDGNGGTASIDVTINVTDVNESPANMAPVFAANLPMTIMGKSGIAITPVTFTATDSDGGTLAYSWNVDETALGLMLDPATGTVSGTPNKAHTGSHPITVVDGQGGSAMHPLTITITGNTAPTFEAFTFPALTANMAHPVTLPAAMDADNDALTYSIRGTLPTGLMASANASMPLTISGTPTAVGTTSVTYVASDNRGGEATLSLAITVNAAPADPQDPAPGAPAAPTGLNANRNDNNSVTLTWTEPTGPITSYLVEVRKVGAASGTTTTLRGSHSRHTTAMLTAGTYTITVAARNAAGTGASASVTVAIPAPPQPQTVPAIILPAGIPNVGGSFAAGTGRVVGETTLSGSIAANSFGVVLADNLPDLENFFRQRGTIVLTDNVSAAGENLGTRAVLISEILWGLDAGEPAGMQDRRQFIELYNTGKTGSVNVTGWKLVFTLHRPAPPNVVDRVSNVGTIVDAGWFMDIGQSGVLTGTTLAGATALGGTGVPVDIISAYRNINYGGVQGGGDRLKAGHVRWGHQKGSWKATTRITTQVGIKASPGARHFVEQGPLTKTNVPFSPFVINEIGNDEGGANDWIELRNVTDSVQSLKNYMLSEVKGVGDEKMVFHFHDQDWKVPAKGIVVIASTDPSNNDNDLAGGDNIAKGQLDEVLEGSKHMYAVPTKGRNNGNNFNIADSGRTLLILRKGYNNKPGDFLPGKQLGNIVDVVGTLRANDPGRGTALWPLHVWGGPHGDVNNDDRGNGHEDFRAGYVYQRDKANAINAEHTVDVRAYTGIGYDRFAATTNENGGTPGYDNGALKHKYSDYSGQISISEIMLVTEESGQAGRVPRATRLPQWIEIYNNSMTQAVTISNWHLEIQNDDTDDFLGNLHGTLRLKNIVVQPNQTVLIVSSSGLSSGNFPPQRTINVFLDGTYRRELGLVNRGDQILNPAGFYIELRDHENRPVDEIGNLGVSRRTGTGRRDNFGEQWELPDMNSVDGHRTSLIRVYNNGSAENGLMADSWRRASDTNFRNVPSLTYYGNHRDFGTPGYRGGGPLPVGLSKFRPERLESGEIVIRWITSSELNNAGFNILRSETKDGQFTKVNTQLIAGKGSTSEATTYEWKDTTAKPNVVYYYQIQDVSIDGQVQTLRTTRLRGHISSTGKATTTWGELKTLQ